jgi:hypothetical protein
VAALSAAPAPAKSARYPAKTKRADEAERVRRALEIWREARDPRGTIVQDYLFVRGWTGGIPGSLRAGVDPVALSCADVGLAIPASLRFHSRLWYSPCVYLPAMVAAIEDMDGQIVGVFRTFLKTDGTAKADVEKPKKALGRERGCAVHLSAGALEMVLCEGIETGLSILQATGRHVWVAVGTSNLGQIELPDFAREIIIAADNDGPGLKAARAAADFYYARRYQVQIVSPRDEMWVFNDLMSWRRSGGCTKGV